MEQKIYSLFKRFNTVGTWVRRSRCSSSLRTILRSSRGAVSSSEVVCSSITPKAVVSDSCTSCKDNTTHEEIGSLYGERGAGNKGHRVNLNKEG